LQVCAAARFVPSRHCAVSVSGSALFQSLELLVTALCNRWHHQIGLATMFKWSTNESNQIFVSFPLIASAATLCQMQSFGSATQEQSPLFSS